jgi:hypothetical protein
MSLIGPDLETGPSVKAGQARRANLPAPSSPICHGRNQLSDRYQDMADGRRPRIYTPLPKTHVVSCRIISTTVAGL